MGKRKSLGPAVAKQKKKTWGSKQVLASPFAPVFPSPTPGTGEKVLEILVGVFPEPFARREPRPLRKSRPNEEDDMEMVDIGKTKEEHPQTTSGEQSELERKPKSCKKPPWLLCGLNEVTRALEKNLVEVAVVCRDVVPSLMIAHLPILCFINNAKLVVLPGDGTDVGALMGTKRLLAWGVRRNCESNPATSEVIAQQAPSGNERKVADRLIKALEPLSTNLDYPWLAAARKSENVPSFPDPNMIPHRSAKTMEILP